MSMGRAEAAALCAQCPALCDADCPSFVGSGRADHGPRALLLDATRGEVGVASLRCNGCGGCAVACEVDVPMPLLLADARSGAAQRAGLWATPEMLLGLRVAWERTELPAARTVLLARCGCGADGGPGEAVLAYAEARGARGVVLVDGVDCGRSLLEHGQLDAFDALAAASGDALRNVRSLVVPSTGCAAAFERVAEHAGLVAFYVSTLDNWLARFGTIAAAPGERVAAVGGCRSGERRPDPILSGTWPPTPVCCGAYGPLAEVAPQDAQQAAASVLEAAIAADRRVLHVGDAVCRAHLRRVAIERDLPVQVVARVDAIEAD